MGKVKLITLAVGLVAAGSGFGTSYWLGDVKDDRESTAFKSAMGMTIILAIVLCSALVGVTFMPNRL